MCISFMYIHKQNDWVHVQDYDALVRRDTLNKDIIFEIDIKSIPRTAIFL